MEAPSVAADRAEAARYALLRRLAPAMRHHLVVNLQPIGMVFEQMDSRLRELDPDLAHVQAGAHRIHGFTQAALHSCLDVVAWLAPEDPVATPVDEGIRECLGLFATSLAFAGYTVRNELAASAGEVNQCALRHVLTAAMVHCTDAVPSPAELVLTGGAQPAGMQVCLEARRVAGEGAPPAAQAYRPIAWDDVEALALAEGVALGRADERVVLTFPWVRPPLA